MAVFFCISVSLLLVFIQMLTSLVLFAGVFIHSDRTLVSPFRLCLTSQPGEPSCEEWYTSPVSGAGPSVFTAVVALCLYVPVVLVAFALLDMLLAAYAKDRAALWFSAACQAASSLLLLTGTVGFLLLYHSYVSWQHMTSSFYNCAAVQVELVITAVLTRVLGRRLTSDWE